MSGLRFGVLAVGLGMMAWAGVGCKSIPPPLPLDQLDPAEMRGHAVFQARCAECHYDRRNGALHGPTLLGMFKQEYLPSGAPTSEERVIATIQHGRGMMPPLGNTMDDADLSDLMVYLHTL